MSTQIIPPVAVEHCPRCGGFVVEDVLWDGTGWSNFSVKVRRCLMCARIFERGKEYGVEVGRLEDAKCYGARPAGIGS